MHVDRDEGNGSTLSLSNSSRSTITTTTTIRDITKVKGSEISRNLCVRVTRFRVETFLPRSLTLSPSLSLSPFVEAWSKDLIKILPVKRISCTLFQSIFSLFPRPSYERSPFYLNRGKGGILIPIGYRSRREGGNVSFGNALDLNVDPPRSALCARRKGEREDPGMFLNICPPIFHRASIIFSRNCLTIREF